MIQIKRAYETPAADDGYRVLVDRLWPRGVSKAKLKLDDWARDLAPSTELRQWFGHEQPKFAEFTKRYKAEIAANPQAQTVLDDLEARAKKGNVTLVFGARDTEHNQAVVLQSMLESRLKKTG